MSSFPTAGEQHAEAYLAAIRQLYLIERRGRDHPPDERRALRQAEAVPILRDLKATLDDAIIHERPTSPLGRAVRYAHEQWAAICRYVDDGRLPIDNNPAENAIRPVVLGRKNYFFGSEDGGAWAAIHYSLIASCRLAGVVPRHYLRDVCDTLLRHPKIDPAALTPMAWKLAGQTAAA